jgi:hypothetical protein
LGILQAGSSRANERECMSLGTYGESSFAGSYVL